MAADNAPELKMDPANLYREEVFTDRKVGTIRVMTPVKNDGSTDAGRKVIYVGETQLMTPVGALPLAFEIEASSLGDAAAKFAGVTRSGRACSQRASEMAAIQLINRHPRRHPARNGRTWRKNQTA